MRKIIAATVFRVIQVVLLPVAVAGYVLVVMKVFAFSRRSGASSTVLASLYIRYMQHNLGTRRDEACHRLMKAMPNVHQLGLGLVTSSTLLAHHLTGHVPRIYRYPFEGEPMWRHQPAARTTLYDQALSRYIHGVNQLVILGAGFDTRAYRLPAGSQVRCFEVDTPKTQTFKREMLAKAGVDPTWVAYVPADFLLDDWLERLVGAGFDPGKPSLFLWESVTMYLDREAVGSTLRKIAGTAAGTVVAFDYLSARLIESGSPLMRYYKAFLRSVGEPWTFGLDTTPPSRTRVAAFVESCGLSLEEQRNFGRERDRRSAEGGFATAIVPSRSSY
jgi:methyltransferase (TIGR00027 family)